MYANYNNSVATDYYIAKSDPRTTGTLFMTEYCTYIQHRQTHSQNISDTHLIRRNGISMITHSNRKNPCIFHCKNPFKTLKATINYNCHYTTMITRSHIVSRNHLVQYQHVIVIASNMTPCCLSHLTVQYSSEQTCV